MPAFTGTSERENGLESVAHNEITMIDQANCLQKGMGGPANGKATEDANGKAQTLAADVALPLDIEHWTTGYVPFSTLIARLVQETFNSLQTLIDELADMSLPPPPTNGVVNHINHRNASNPINDTSYSNVQKKTKLFEFANSKRGQFIKILVLSRWAQQVEAISKAIDLRIWLSQRQEDYNSAVSWMGELKRKMTAVPEPSPNIETALRILSSEKIYQFPETRDLSSIRPSLSSREALAGIRRLNAVLAVRLNLQEKLPDKFRNFTIKSGRASFLVPDEFEVDVSLADENPQKPFYFIDLRFDFSPAPVLPVGYMRDELEYKANEVLRLEGLHGLFSFIREFTLTQKIAILRSQAFTMSRGFWADHIKVEAIRRALVVQYWCTRTGAKNWIDIGIKRGRFVKSAYDNEEDVLPELSLRWFREGKEMQNIKIDLRPAKLSIKFILDQIIAQHASYNFTEMQRNLSQSALFSMGALRLVAKSSVRDPTKAGLLVQTTQTRVIKVVQESVSGRFAIMPASRLNGRAEQELNRTNPPPGEALAHLRSFTAIEAMEASSRCVGWDALPLQIATESVRNLFPKDTQKLRCFSRAAWSTDWILVFTAGLNGDMWWVAQPNEWDPALGDGKRVSLRRAFKVTTDEISPLLADPSPLTLAAIERNTIGIIAQLSDSQCLTSLGISHRLNLAASNQMSRPVMSIYMQPPRKHDQPMSYDGSGETFPWVAGVIKLEYRGLNPRDTRAIHFASFKVNQYLSTERNLANEMPGAIYNPTTGVLAFELSTKIGESTVPALTDRISILERLQTFMSTIKLAKLLIHACDLTSIQFTYAQRLRAPLRATVHFPATSAPYLTLTAPNPHLRIVDFLTRQLRTMGLRSTLALLRITLPILLTFLKLERFYGSDGLSIVPLSAISYRVRYPPFTSKLSRGYDIRLRARRDEVKWFIAEDSILRGDAVSSETTEGLNGITYASGTDWRGMRGGVVAGLWGVQDVVEKMNALFMATATKDMQEARPGKRKAEDTGT